MMPVDLVAPVPVEIPVEGAVLRGDLAMPEGAVGIVAFAHGSGSGRHSPRNRFVAGALQRQKLGTLLFDLLTLEEEEGDALSGRLRFDIDLLAARLARAVDWLAGVSETQRHPVGLFGASTGGGAALVAAAHRPDTVSAVVSRGGRPDLAGTSLARVRASTLLIVGERDAPVLALNERALARLQCEKQLVVIPGATHLFEEPGALEEVARIAGRWFVRHMAPVERAPRRASGDRWG